MANPLYPNAAPAGLAPWLPAPKPKSPLKVGLTIPWVQVRSSWIDALRFIPVSRVGNQALSMGYLDMRVKKGLVRYRYGTRGVLVPQRSFNTWVVAASRGKYFWRYWTRKYSPAVKL